MESATDTFLKSVKVICPDLNDVALSQFATILDVKELKKKELFLQSEKVQKVIGFIAQGLIRSFFIDPEGNEITVGFYSEGDYATHYPAFITRQPSKYSIQCLEPTTFVCFSFQDMQWIYRQSPNIERYGRL